MLTLVKDFGLYSKHNGKPLKSFNSKAFFKVHIGSYVNNTLQQDIVIVQVTNNYDLGSRNGDRNEVIQEVCGQGVKEREVFKCV